MSANDEFYSSEATQHFRAPGRAESEPPPPVRTDGIDPSGDFDDEYEADRVGTRWHAGLDLGLLILRIAVGGAMLLKGLYKFGVFEGGSIDAVATMLGEKYAFSNESTLAWVLAGVEVGAGGALILGLFTPLAAAAILAVTSCVVYLDRTVGYFPEMTDTGQTPGYAYPLLIGAGALVLLFTGPGRAAIDAGFPWRKRPVGWGIFGIVLAAVTVVGVLALFR